ncbi:MAG: hypothetical protein ACT6U0_11255, partial [Shinella sp.]
YRILDFATYSEIKHCSAAVSRNVFEVGYKSLVAISDRVIRVSFRFEVGCANVRERQKKHAER